MASALVVYESIFGDARRIAEAVAGGLRSRYEVDVVAASQAPTEVGTEVELLVVGGPNHAFSMPRESTRQGAIDQHGAVVEDTTTGLHEWLDAVRLPAGLRAAAFDTRMDHPKLVVKLDHASRTEEKLLKAHGATLVADAEHFRVTDAKGPLADGEEERASRWGRALAAQS
jgi:predicted methyltransferase MtxX (methanogen marker protein 4)